MAKKKKKEEKEKVKKVEETKIKQEENKKNPTHEELLAIEKDKNLQLILDDLEGEVITGSVKPKSKGNI